MPDTSVVLHSLSLIRFSYLLNTTGWIEAHFISALRTVHTVFTTFFSSFKMADQPRQRGRPPLPIEVREQRARKRTQSRAELLRFNRQDDDYREEENARNRQRQAAARAVDAVRIEANFQNAARRRNVRAANPAQAAAARAADAQRHRERRQDNEARAAEQAVNTQQRRKRRQDEEVRAAEREADAQRHRKKRQDDEARVAEQALIRPQTANYQRRLTAWQNPKI